MKTKNRYKSIKTFYTPEKNTISIAFQEKSFTDVKHLSIDEVKHLMKLLKFHLDTYDMKIVGIADF